jgi:hypothetical protein
MKRYHSAVTLSELAPRIASVGKDPGHYHTCIVMQQEDACRRHKSHRTMRKETDKDSIVA